MGTQFLNRRQLADALTEAGFPISFATLATKASRGGGPPYRIFGGKALYRLDDALEWANNLSVPSKPNNRSE